MTAQRVEVWALEQDPAHLMCRDTGIRHPWDPRTSWSEKGGVAEELLCGRCGAIKIRYLTRAGMIKKHAKFIYPKGYVREGQGRVTKKENATIRILSMSQRYDMDNLGPREES